MWTYGAYDRGHAGAMRDGGTSATQAGSMLIIRNGRRRIRDGFVRIKPGIRSGFTLRIGAHILATGTIPARSTAGNSAGTSSISDPALRVQSLPIGTRTITQAPVPPSITIPWPVSTMHLQQMISVQMPMSHPSVSASSASHSGGGGGGGKGKH